MNCNKIAMKEEKNCGKTYQKKSEEKKRKNSEKN